MEWAVHFRIAHYFSEIMERETGGFFIDHLGQNYREKNNAGDYASGRSATKRPRPKWARLPIAKGTGTGVAKCRRKP